MNYWANKLMWISTTANTWLFGGRYWQTTSSHIGEIKVKNHWKKYKFSWTYYGVVFWLLDMLLEATDDQHAVEAFHHKN